MEGPNPPLTAPPDRKLNDRSVTRLRDAASTYMTAAAVAELLGVNRATVYRLASTDASMPAMRLGAGVVRFRSDLLHAWLEARTQRSRSTPGAQGRAVAR